MKKNLFKITKKIAVFSLIAIFLTTTSCVTNANETSKSENSDTSKNNTSNSEPSETFDSRKVWTDQDVPSLCQTYKDYFDLGIAVGKGELMDSSIQEGIVKHSSTITMGNEFKPDFIFNWGWWNVKPSNLTNFTASNGETIKVPTTIPTFASQDQILQTCKDLDLKMRGHVLVWHSQTPDNFFYEDYDTSKKLVDTATMTARQEWYIKTVVEHVQNWEKENNNGKHIIWAWDVVNEAVADGSSNLRSSGSKWYEVYKNYDFIVNAFRFANKYVSPDVLLCYNDYNCTYSSKRTGMLKIIDKVLEAKDDSVLPTRIDAMGLQSHINVNTTVSDYQNTITAFVNKGLDIHVTELDIATEKTYNPSQLAKVYKNFFNLFIKNRKTVNNHGISCVTIWGINDESTWLNTESQIKWHGNVTQYPLLFELNDNEEYVAKDAFWSVIEAATSSEN